MGVAFTLGSSLLGVYSQNMALEAQGRANRETARSMVQSMNYNLQNLEQERRDIFEATVQELERTQMQGRCLSSSVNAAVNEGLSVMLASGLFLRFFFTFSPFYLFTFIFFVYS